MLALVYLATTLPIGSHEANIYFEGKDILHYLTHCCENQFSNGLDFRLPFVVVAFFNIFLFFKVSKIYLDTREARYLSTMIFLLLPGIITSGVLVNIASLVISLLLLFLIFYEQQKRILQLLTVLILLVLHDASIIFFITIACFSLYQRKLQEFAVIVLLLLVDLVYFTHLDISGKPMGEFLELFGLYIALFSPLVFFYFFYALYRIALREEKNILWFISFYAFVFSIILSLRQQVIMTDFAPYVIVSVVLMLNTYHKTLYVRLPIFQKRYRFFFYLAITSLVMSASIIFLHKSFFYFLDDKSKHFAYPFYEPYWQVLELKEIGQKCYTVRKKKVQYQLKYYGIDACREVDVPKIHR